MKILFKRYISVVLSLVLILSMFSVLPFNVSAEKNTGILSGENTQPLEIGTDILQKNARASSEQYPTSSGSQGTDGSALDAFDDDYGDGKSYWHSRWSRANSDALRPENVIGEQVCDGGVVNGQVSPSSNYSVWIQTGFVDTENGIDEEKAVGGFTYIARKYGGRGTWKEFEVWVSDEENMNSHAVVYSTDGKSPDDPNRIHYINNPTEMQTVYFDFPAVGKYIRFIVKDVYCEGNGGDGCGTSERFVTADNIKFLEINEEKMPEVFEATKAYDLNNRDTDVNNWSEFYTQDSINAYSQTITDAENCDTSNNDSVMAMLKRLDLSRTGLTYTYCKVNVSSGVYADTVSVAPGTGVKAAPVNSGSTVYIGANTSADKKTVDLSCTHVCNISDLDLPLYWYDESGERVTTVKSGTTDTYTLPEQSENVTEITLTADGVLLSEYNTHELTFTDTSGNAVNVLEKNARASSEKYPDEYSDGCASWAFDSVNHWWHTGYVEGKQLQNREDNKIGGEYCGIISEDGQVNPEIGKSVWIQTGFVDAENQINEAKTIGGFSFLPRTDNARGTWRDFEVWVSDNENMEPHIVAYTTEGRDERPIVPKVNEPSKVYFDEPVVGKYIRFIIKDVYTSTNYPNSGLGLNNQTFATGKEIKIFEVNSDIDIYNDLLDTSLIQNHLAYGDVLEWKEFYTQESLDTYNSQINALVEKIRGGGETDKAQAVADFKSINDAKVGLTYAYNKVEASSGMFAAGASVQALDGQIAPINTENVAYIGSNTNGEERRVTISVHDVFETVDLTFDGWKNGEEKVYDSESVTFNVTDDIHLVASYTGFNGDPSDSTTVEINSELLKSNARSNSERYPGGWNTDGSADYAFNDANNNWWHTRYTDDRYPEAEYRDANVFSDGTRCETSLDSFTASVSTPIWIQTGFDDGDPATDDVKMIGGFLYTSRGNNTNRIGDFQIWASKYDNMDRDGYQVIYSGTFDTTKSGCLSEGTFIPFDFPCEAKYVRIVVTSNQGGSFVTAQKIAFYEYTGPEAQADVKIKLDGEDIDSLNVTGHQMLIGGEVSVTDDEFKDAVINDDGLLDRINSDYDNIAYNYTLDTALYDREEKACVLKKEAARYTLQYNTDTDASAEQAEYKAVSANYGEHFRDENGNIVSADEGYYWTDNDGNVICPDSSYTLVATGNVTVKIALADAKEVRAYIPAPVISKTAASGSWKIEIPVSFHNVIDWSTGSKKLSTDVIEFGLVILPDSETDASEILLSGTGWTAKSTAFLNKSTDHIVLTNKGRYLHALTVSSTERARQLQGQYIYAFIKLGGNTEETADDYYIVSKPWELNFPGL